jgi:hypothetical protein
MQQFRRQLPGPSVIALLALAAPAQSVVSPAGRAQCEGSSFTHFPLGRPNARFQFLYADVPPQMVLHGMAYRREAVNNHGHVDAFNADLQVTLSIAPLAPPQTSGTFANNVGTAATVVLPRTVLSFPATERPALDPAPSFDFAIPFAVPFTMPAAPATLCVDIAMFGNTSPAGTDRSLSIYLDSHDYVNGRQEQPGYELGAGCAAPGSSTPMTAALSLWHLGTSMQFDLSMRNGVPDDGSLQARTFLCLGANQANVLWPGRSPCALLTTTDVWFAMPGNDTATGSYDGSLTGLPVLPPGFRLWCQAGSVHLGNGALAFGDLSTLVTPPPPPASAPFARVSASTDRTAATGAVSFVVPVTQFF